MMATCQSATASALACYSWLILRVKHRCFPGVEFLQATSHYRCVRELIPTNRKEDNMSLDPRSWSGNLPSGRIAVFAFIAALGLGGTAAEAADRTSQRLDEKALQMCDGTYAI